MSLRSVVSARALTALFSLMPWASCADDGTPAAQLRLIGAETEFFCYRDAIDGKPAGFACELLREMAHRVGHAETFDIYPLPRALAVAAGSPHTLIAPVGRIAARDKQFAWQIELFEEDFVLVTRQSSTQDISSDEALRRLHIGAVRDGVGARLLLERGVGIVDAVAGDLANARKLDMGRIDAWASSWNAVLAAQRSAGLPVDRLRRGLLLGRIKVCLAGSFDIDPASVAAWKAAFIDIRKDGTYDRLARKYQYQPPVGDSVGLSGTALKAR